MRPRGTPIGLQLARVSKNVGRAFNHALAEVGGSWRCGAEVAPIDSDATRTWRWIVDSLN